MILAAVLVMGFGLHSGHYAYDDLERRVFDRAVVKQWRLTATKEVIWHDTGPPTVRLARCEMNAPGLQFTVYNDGRPPDVAFVWRRTEQDPDILGADGDDTSLISVTINGRRLAARAVRTNYVEPLTPAEIAADPEASRVSFDHFDVELSDASLPWTRARKLIDLFLNAKSVIVSHNLLRLSPSHEVAMAGVKTAFARCTSMIHSHRARLAPDHRIEENDDPYGS